MRVRGKATLDFGDAPGASDTSVFVSAPDIEAGSIPSCWVLCEATDDHTAQEHAVEPIIVRASAPTAGSGFTIYGALEPRGEATRTYGLFRVGWEY
jgi:hypothetical protein